MDIMALVVCALVGIVVGLVLAQWVLRSFLFGSMLSEQGAAIVAGVVGALLGGAIGNRFFVLGRFSLQANMMSFIIEIVGAVVLLAFSHYLAQAMAPKPTPGASSA